MTDKTKSTKNKAKARDAQSGERGNERAEENEAQAAKTTAETGPDAPAAADAPPPVSGGRGGDAEFPNPYKAVFTSTTHGFELGEHRRFKQRLFTFRERPEDAVLAALKEHGFTYRPAEKAWSIPISAESRVLTDRLAREFAGGDRGNGRG
jgi:hypothetical protein